MINFLKQFALRLLPGAILGFLLIGAIAAIPDSKVERAKASWHILDYPAKDTTTNEKEFINDSK
jgi:hypothetical protein